MTPQDRGRAKDSHARAGKTKAPVPQDRGEAQHNWCGEAKEARTRQKAETPPEMHIPLTCSTHQMNALTKPYAQQVFGSTSFSPLLAHAHIKT